MTTGACLCMRCGRISESGTPICAACEISAAVRGPTTKKDPTIPLCPTCYEPLADGRCPHQAEHDAYDTPVQPSVPLSEHQRVQAEAAAKDAAAAQMRRVLEMIRRGIPDHPAPPQNDDERDCACIRCEAVRGLASDAGSGWLSPEEAERLKAETREKILDELALEIGFGERPEGRSGVHRPDDLAAAIKGFHREQTQEIDRRSAYVDAWDEYFRAAKGSDREGRQLAAISKARDAWERDTEPEEA